MRRKGGRERKSEAERELREKGKIEKRSEVEWECEE
jgi:hypothetical protein